MQDAAQGYCDSDFHFSLEKDKREQEANRGQKGECEVGQTGEQRTGGALLGKTIGAHRCSVVTMATGQVKNC